MAYVNMTPHVVEVYSMQSGKHVATFNPSGVVARIDVEYTFSHVDENGISIFDAIFGEPSNVPENDGNVYIVSSIFKSAFPGRKDFVCPAILKRDESGKVIGCYGFTQ